MEYLTNSRTFTRNELNMNKLPPNAKWIRTLISERVRNTSVDYEEGLQKTTKIFIVQ